MKRADGHQYGWAVRLLSAVLSAALILGVVGAGLTIPGEGWASDQRETEAYGYLKEHLDGLEDGWAARALREIASWFSGTADAAGCRRKAGACLNRGDETGALSWLDKAAQVSQGAEKAEAVLLAACLSDVAGNHGAAAAYAREAVSFAPEDRQARWFLYLFLLNAGDQAGAAEALAAYAGVSGETGRYEAAARLATENGDYPAAIRYYSMAMHGGKSDELLYLRGVSYQNNGEMEAAASDFALSAYPGSLYALGACEWALGRGEDAARRFEACIARGENENDARRLLAIIRVQSGAYTQAEALFDEYLSAGGKLVDIAYYRGTARAMAGDYDGAIGDFDLSALTEEFGDDGLFWGAQCRYLAGRFSEAAERLTQCVKQGVYVSQSRYYLGLSYVQLGDMERAAEQLKLALGE